MSVSESATVFSVSFLTFALLLNYVPTLRKEEGVVFSKDDVKTFQEEGILPLRRLTFTEQELAEITEELLHRVEHRGENVKAENLLNLHFTDDYVLGLARHPKVLHMVQQLIGDPDVGIKIFATRILCKLPGIGAAIPWHQDSNYWDLKPLEVVSWWLALDDVTLENGGMKMLNFTAMPQSNGHNLPTVQTQSDTHETFFKYVDDKYIPEDKVLLMDLKRGESEFHNAWVLHSSPKNLSKKRRCAWIVRYVPQYVEFVKGGRLFPDDYVLVKAK